jgi:CheY-like chemotaxis protein
MGAHDTVLVVDDDRLILASVAAALEGAGFRVWTTDSGEEAVQLAGRVRPDAVVTDLRMPGMDGLALLERLAQETRPVPWTAIIYSATPPAGDDDAQLHGARWIPKASGHEALIDALSTAGMDTPEHR